ncbi:uncharacterized protein LOC142236554 [Haematobia irritans]|uniref:Putative secreted protein n=1 Tax=Haematobia irritans TaxID=7368 RepID=A0A1L8EBM4_HAEIR
MKFLVVLGLVCALGLSQAQMNYGMGMGMGFGMGMKTPFAGMLPGQFFQTVVLQSEAGKLLLSPDLPEDLRQRVLDTVTLAEEGFANCSAPGALPWMQIRCSAFQLQKSKNELKAIENEALLRAQAQANEAATNVV